MPSLLLLHLRQAVRGLRRNPTFATAVLLTLALSIGANTAVFTVVNGVLLNPLPYPEPETLVSVLTRAPGAPNAPGASGGITDMPESASMYATFSENNRSFDSLGIFDTFPLTVLGDASSEQIRAVGASRGVLEALRVKPMLGRSFVDGDYHLDGRPPDNVILGWGYWQRRFGGDPSVVGRTLRNDSASFRIVGVMPQGFRVVTVEPEVIVPMSLDRSRLVLVFFQYQMIGRLKPGVTFQQANTELERLVYVWGGAWPMPPGFQSANPRPFDSWRFSSVAQPLKDDVVDRVANLLWVLMATIGIVMLIACANVGNLVLVRSEARQHEFAVQMALGSGRARLIAGWLVESLVLSVLGGALGTALAYAGVRVLKAFGPANIPRLAEVAVDGRVLAFALAVSILSGIVFGLIPALKYAGRHLSGMLAGGRGASDGRDRQRTRNGLVVAQVALALVLLVSSGLMIRTFLALRSVAPGFDPANVQTIRVTIPATAAPTADRLAQTHAALLQALETIPGVGAAALSTSMPMEGLVPGGAGTPFFPVLSERDTPDRSRSRPLRPFKYVSPGYFRLSKTRVLVGREYTWSDLDNLRPVAVVSNTLAVELWGSPAAALGQRLRASQNATWRQVIGVVDDVRDGGASQPAPATMYWPSRTESLGLPVPDVPSRVTLAVRSAQAGSPGLIDAMRERVSSVNASIAVSTVRTLQEVYDGSMEQTSFVLIMLGIAAFMALTLGLIGVYGVVAYAVARRTREVGIRLALGAQQQELRRMFLTQALVLTGIGTAIGLAAAAGVTRVLASLLFAVTPVDPLTYLAVALVVTAATLLASYLPARRASLTSPVVALRAE